LALAFRNRDSRREPATAFFLSPHSRDEQDSST